MKFLLDANAWIGHLRHTSPTVTHRLSQYPASEIVLCSVVLAELLYGAERSGPTHRAKNFALVARLRSQSVSLPFDDSAAEEVGTLTFVDNAVDMTTGTIKLKGTFPNTDHQLWPGQFVRVNLRQYLLHKAERKLQQQEASLQDFRDLKRKRQVPSDSRESIEKTISNEPGLSLQLRKPRRRIRGMDPAVLVAIVGAGGTALGALIGGVLQIATLQRSRKVVIRGRTGRQIELTGDVEPDGIDKYIKIAREIDIDRIEIVSSQADAGASRT